MLFRRDCKPRTSSPAWPFATPGMQQWGAFTVARALSTTACRALTRDGRRLVLGIERCAHWCLPATSTLTLSPCQLL